LRIAARRSRDGRVEIDVADTGVGIPPEELPKIFDLYYTTRNEGSGVGLSLVYRIIQLHDGDIRVSSTPGAGTRFTITLPEVPA
jgi:signal transduction histidine kinase